MIDAEGEQVGIVSLEEAQAAMPEMTAEQFNRRDRNGDGYLSKEDRPKRGQ